MPKLVYTTDVADAIAKIRQVNEEAGRKAQEALKGTAQETRKLSALQKQLLRESETAQEKYNKKVAALKGLLASNKIGVDKYKEAVGRATKELKGADKAGSGAFGGPAVSRLKNYVLGFGAVYTAVRLVTNELRAQQELVNKAEMAKLTVSQSRNVLRRNLLSLPKAEREQVVGRFGEVARALNIGEAPVQQAAAQAVSASGGDVAASLAAVRLAARMFPDQPGQIGEVAGSLLDLSKVTGTRDPMVNFGLLLQTAALSRVVNPKEQATNVAPALIGATAFGASPQGAGALFSSITTAAADPTGRKSGTAVVNLAKQMFEFEGLTELPDMTSRLRALQSDRGLALKFLDESSFQAKMLGPIRQLLLDPKSDAAKSFTSNLGQFDPKTLLMMAARGPAAIDTDVIGASAKRTRGIMSAVESTRLSARGALSQEERDAINEIVMRAGATALGARVADTMETLTSGGRVTLPSVIRRLERRREDIQEDGLYRPGLLGVPERVRRQGVVDKAESDITEAINTLRAVLEQTQKDQIEQQKETNRKLSEGGLIGVAE